MQEPALTFLIKLNIRLANTFRNLRSTIYSLKKHLTLMAAIIQQPDNTFC